MRHYYKKRVFSFVVIYMQLILEYGQFVFAITWTELFAHGRITYGYRERLIHEARRVVSETNATIWQRAQAHAKTFRRILLYMKQKLTKRKQVYNTIMINSLMLVRSSKIKTRWDWRFKILNCAAFSSFVLF